MQEIQFLEFRGGSNSTHTHSNYLICMCFIINTAKANIATDMKVVVSKHGKVCLNKGMIIYETKVVTVPTDELIIFADNYYDGTIGSTIY